MNGPLPPLSDSELASWARQAGFSGEGLLTIIATVLAESGADPDNVGDEKLQDALWGPSFGLAQIRSLWSDQGTGGPRDGTRLTDPLFNLRSAYAISSGGTNFKPWTAFTNGDYRSFLDRAWSAVASTGGTAQVGTGFNGAAGVATLTGVDLPGDLVADVVEPITSGLARISLVGAFLAGGVALIVLGGWRTVAPAGVGPPGLKGGG